MNTYKTITNIPPAPGVYRFLDQKGRVLYLGKAKNLKNRIKQYFMKELGRGPAIEIMVKEAADIKWIETDSEIEAVILEAELIKKLKPKYNVRLKDDKSFLAIRIAKNGRVAGGRSGGEFPIVELVRFKNIDLSDRTADYFGPYPSGLLLKKSLQYLRKIFPFRDCSKTKFNTYRKKGRPCIYGDIRVCSGPCNDWVDEKQYVKNISYLKSFLRGKKKLIIESLEKEMNRLSRAKKFEEAALVRNKLAALNHLKDVAIGLRDDVFEKRIIFKRIECYDIANLPTGRQVSVNNYAVGSMVVFSDGKPDKDEYRKFKINSSVISSDQRESRDLSFKISPPTLSSRNDNESDLSRLKQVLERRFTNDWPNPDLIVIDGGTLQLKIALEVLQNSSLDIPVVSISKGPERKKNDFHYGNPFVASYLAGNEEAKNILISARDEAHRFAIEYYRKLHRKDLIK